MLDNPNMSITKSVQPRTDSWLLRYVGRFAHAWIIGRADLVRRVHVHCYGREAEGSVLFSCLFSLVVVFSRLQLRPL
jgi:hypothetical protein